jgi:Zn-dependent protease with chaperone function
MKTILTSLFLFLGVLPGVALIAQVDFDRDYTPVLATSKIPDVFLEDRKQTLSRDLSTVRKSGKLTAEQGKEFLVLNNEALRNTFHSGRVLFGDEVTNYLNEVAQRLVAANPDYTGGLNLFATRVTVPNAAAWRNGVILFNVGLLSRLDTESQLAFILAHEMAHIQNKHTLQKFTLAVSDGEYVDPDNRRKLRGKAFGRGSLDLEKVFKKYRYSRQFEMEADKQGLEWLKKSPYRAHDASRALEILRDIDKDRHSMIPPLESFNPDSLLKIPAQQEKNSPAKKVKSNKEFIAFKLGKNDTLRVDPVEEDIKPASIPDETDITPEKKKKKKRPIDEGYLEGEMSEEEFLDSTRTHPSIEDRLAQIQTGMPSSDIGESFISSPMDFIKIRTIARFEMVETHFEGMNYLKAFYEALQLLKEYPDNAYLVNMVCKSAYWYTIMENESYQDHFTPKPKYYKGEAWGEFINYFDNLSKEKRSSWCLGLLEKYQTDFPDNHQVQFVLAQAYAQFEMEGKAKALYEKLLPVMRETHGAYIQDKINNL